MNPIASTGAAPPPGRGVPRQRGHRRGTTGPIVAFSCVFSPPTETEQTVTVYRATGEQARAHEAAGEPILTDVPVSFGTEPVVAESGPYLFFAGFRSDPFFADLDGIVNKFQWTGVDWGSRQERLRHRAGDAPRRTRHRSRDRGVGPVSLWQDGQLTSVDRWRPPLPDRVLQRRGRQGGLQRR
ncbi:hypothetical protein LT493_44170 [Streptomyces tricolor]|nr:hypothetical protein [Streptomyces tricolor]